MTEDPPRLSRIMGRDHRDLDELWARVVATPATDREGRRPRFAAFRTGLLAHIAEEEEHLFPVLDETDPALRKLAARLLDEHREIRGILDQIDRAFSSGSGEIEALGLELVNVLGEHNAREEGFVYPWLDGHLSADQVRDVQRRLDRGERE